MINNTKIIALLLCISFLTSFTQKEDKCTNKNHEKAVDIYLQGSDKDRVGNLKEARLDFLKSIELDPECKGIFQSYRELIYCELGLNQGEDALAHLDAALTKSAPNSVTSEFYFLKGLLLYKSNNKIDCIKNCTSAISFDNTNIRAYFYRGRAKVDLGDNQGAMKDLTFVINEYENIFYRDPNIEDDLIKMDEEVKRAKFESIIGPAYLFRGYLFNELLETNKACNDWSKAGDEGMQQAYSYIKEFCK